ncbi:MAG TPA: hypothetical protein VF689_10070, partial [Allosphingosinicella sp.]
MGEETAFHAFADRLSGVGSERDDAARELLARYAARLVALARGRMSSRLQAKVAPEDVLQSVMRTFFRRLDAGEVELRGWAGQWGFLPLATLRKCQKNSARYAAASRDLGREVSLRIEGGDGEAWELAVPDREPTYEVGTWKPLGRWDARHASSTGSPSARTGPAWPAPETTARSPFGILPPAGRFGERRFSTTSPAKLPSDAAARRSQSAAAGRRS